MILTIIHLPSGLRIEVRQPEERGSSPPPPIDAPGEEVPESNRGEVIELRRTG